MKLTEENYYSSESNVAYMSVSQFKDFMKCEEMALAKIRGEYVPERTKALLLGSYVDEMLTGTLDSQNKFIEENFNEIFQKRADKKYADFAQADETIERVKAQPLMMHFLNGEHQTIMTGEIEGVPIKIKMDCYKEGEFISDLKYMASLRSPNLFEPMIKYWGYDIQAAVYQEIVYQNTGKRLPFYFVVATKEKPAHLVVGEINQWNMDEALEKFKQHVKRFHDIKLGLVEPERCEDYNCDYCTATHIITEPIDTDCFGMSAAQMKAMKGEI